MTEQQDGSIVEHDEPTGTEQPSHWGADPAEVDEAVVGDTPDPDHEPDYLEPGQTELEVEPEVVVDDETMRRALEAILMVTDEPLPVLTLARAVGRPTADVSAALTELSEEYTEQGRGFDLREVAGGWRYYTREDAAPYVEKFVLDGQQARLTQAALETLAVVAYKQPVSRARVSAIRGVNVDGVMRTLVTRGLVEEAGADTESQATLYRTTSYFLERMGMQSLEDLPELAPYLPEMDDMEEELAAQNPPAAPDEGATDTDDAEPVTEAAPEQAPDPAPGPDPEPDPAPGLDPEPDPLAVAVTGIPDEPAGDEADQPGQDEGATPDADERGREGAPEQATEPTPRLDPVPDPLAVVVTWTPDAPAADEAERATQDEAGAADQLAQDEAVASDQPAQDDADAVERREPWSNRVDD